MVKCMHQLRQQIQVVFYYNQRLLNVFKIIFIAFVVFGKGKIHLLFDANIIHCKPFVFSFKLAVYP